MHRLGPRLGSLLFEACTLVALATLSACSAGHGPPNIVVIVTDDQAFSTLPYMPLVDQYLVREGVRLDNFILSDPLCCPSRVTILLGQYRHNHHHETGWPGCSSLFYQSGGHERAIGLLLHEAGYRTGVIGKYLNSYGQYRMGASDAAGPRMMIGWDDYHALTGSTKYVGFNMDDNGKISRYETEHQSDVLAKVAVQFITESSKRPQPFFLYVTPQAPHSPVKPATRHRTLFPLVKAPRGPSFDQVDTSGQPSLAKTARLSARSIATIDHNYLRTLQTLQSVDDMVGEVVLALERAGLLENTYIFYTSDNGLHFGEHRISKGKGTPFEESIRFPLIVRGPGIPKGIALPHLASNVDLYPTLLDLVGEVPEPHVDGRSLLPLLGGRGPACSWRKSLVIESDHEPRNQGVPRFQGIRSERYKLIEYVTGDVELYDLERDPHEVRNVLGETDPTLVRDLRARLGELAHCVGEECVRLENAAIGQGDQD